MSQYNVSVYYSHTFQRFIAHDHLLPNYTSFVLSNNKHAIFEAIVFLVCPSACLQKPLNCIQHCRSRDLDHDLWPTFEKKINIVHNYCNVKCMTFIIGACIYRAEHFLLSSIAPNVKDIATPLPPTPKCKGPSNTSTPLPLEELSVL